MLKNKRKILTYLGTMLGLLATILAPAEKKVDSAGASMLPVDVIEAEQLGAFPIVIPTIKYGFALDTFQVEENKVQRNQTLGSLLSSLGFGAFDIEQLTANAKGVFELTRDFRTGRNYTVLSDEVTGLPQYLIIEPNVFEYVIFKLRDGMKVEKVLREITTKRNSVVGQIESSLWAALTQQGVGHEAAAKMEDALQWAVDFSHTQKGDEFKLLYDEHFIKDQPVGTGQVYAAYYKRDNKEHYSFWFDNGDYKGYYDLEGRPAKSSFLKSPVKFTRISSSYNLKRFHPILKSVRPHLGTDYAAPHGTPIYTVGDGTVEEAGYSKGNGNYVKIRHDKVYQTQYLHMSRFAKGIRRGARVSQGDVIGYVGSTGLATGPHVCFRFWKNGKQVNHLRENLPQARQLPREVLEEFYKKRDEYLLMLKGEPFHGQEVVPAFLGSLLNLDEKSSSP